MDAEIDKRVKQLLGDRKGDWQVVATESGVSYSWISKFMNERIGNPGLGTLRKLMKYLSQDQTELASQVNAHQSRQQEEAH